MSCVLSDPPPSGLEEVGQSPRELCKWSPLTFSSVWLAGWSLFAFFSEAGASPPWEGHLVKILPWGDEQDADLCTGGDGTVSFDISGTGSESQAKALVLPPVVRTGTTSPAAPPMVPGTACSYLGHPPLASLGTVGLWSWRATRQGQHLSLGLPGGGEDRRRRTSGRNLSFREVCLQPDNHRCNRFCLPAAIRQPLTHCISFQQTLSSAIHMCGS